MLYLPLSAFFCPKREMRNFFRLSFPPYLNGKVFELLPGSQIDEVFVDAGLSLQELLVQKVENDFCSRFCIDRYSKVIRMSGRYANMAYEKKETKNNRLSINKN
jgi:hypothetical protein